MKSTQSITPLLVLILFFVGSPFVYEQRALGMVLRLILFTALLAGMVYGMSYSRRVLTVGAAGAVAAIVLLWGGHVAESPDLRVAGAFFLFATLLLATVVATRHLLRQREATGETMRQAVVAYLLLGVSWSVLYMIVLHFDPRALDGVIQPRLQELLYFSFVTLTTLGYGDITPATHVTQSLVAFEALAGQIFLTFLVARLVGMHIAKQR